MKKIATGLGTIALFAAALLPAVAAGNDCSNGTTGPFSTNYCDITNKSEVEVKNVNDAQITNDVTAKVNTGKNSASYNTLGGEIKTGDAELDAKISNVANINTTYVSGGPFGGNNYGQNDITGPYSDNRVDIYNKEEVEVENSNTATVDNDIYAKADTGKNYADYNTGPGDIHTGDAWLDVRVLNHVNDNATEVEAGAGGSGDNRVYNFTTGPYSTNYADITNKFDADVKNINDAIIENDITAKVRTGRNSASYNTLGGDIDTGDAEGDIDVNSEGNINTTTISTAMGGFDNVAGNDLTGPFSDNQEDISNKQEIEVENWNNKCKSHNADRLGENNEVDNFNWEWPWKKNHCDPEDLGVFNYDYDVVDTGKNDADYNTGGGDVFSGWADLWKSIKTHLNDTLTVIQ